MQYVEVKGMRVPAIGLGTWQLSGRGCYESVREALDLGYRHIDTAQMYGNEQEVGHAVRDSGVARDAVFITTKLAPGNLAPAAVQRSTEESLERLGMDHVDLLLIHWPSSSVKLGETLHAMAALHAAGKARHLGVSNFTVKLLAEAAATGAAELLCNQVEYHPFLSQRPVLAALASYGMMLTAYSPLARGRVARDAPLLAIARKYGKSPAQVTLRWLIDQEGVAAVPKAAGRQHLAANLDIFDFALSAEDRAAIDALRGSERVVDVAGWSPRWDPP
jgi:2,5-diketo-D-gluconate reductase B